MSKKKPFFPINIKLNEYLNEYNRNLKIPIFYEDLKRFSGSFSVFNKDDKDTLWVRVFYSEHERKDIDLSLKKVYNLLHRYKICIGKGGWKIIEFTLKKILNTNRRLN